MAVKKRRCKCCRHDEPHCICRLDKPPRPTPQPITKKPKPSQIVGWLNLLEIAYVVGQRHHMGITVPQVSGAVRALNLKNDTTLYQAKIRGCVVFRQTTMVHPTMLSMVEHYLVEKYQ